MEVWLRIDDRLIHGQVVEGWVPHLRASRILVVSDEAARDPVQKALMRLAVPEGMALEIEELSAACARAGELGRGEANGPVLVLTPSPKEALRLLEAGLEVRRVNVGGLHHSVGKVQLGRALFLAEEDREALKAIAARGVELDARAVPSERGLPIAQMLDPY